MGELEEALEDRLEGGGDYPDFYDFDEEGDKIVGKVVKTNRSSQYNEDASLYDVEDMDGTTWTLPENKILYRLLDENEVERGDYIMAVHTGKVKTSGGRYAKNYKLGVLSKKEAEKLMEGETSPEEMTSEEPEEEPAEEEPKEPSEEEVEEETEEESTGLDNEELEDYMDELYGFYDSMSREDLDNYINDVRDFGIPVDVLIDEFGLEENEEGEFVRP